MIHDIAPHRDHDPFNLSERFLLDVMHASAEALVLSGKIEPNEDATPYARDDERQPYDFSYHFPNDIAQAILSTDYVVEKAKMEYAEPHRLGEPPDDQLSTLLSLKLRGKLPKTDVTVEYTYTIRNDEAIGEVLGEVDVEYSGGETSLSHKKTNPNTQYKPDDPRRYGAAIEQIDETCRKMTLDDIEKIQQLTEYITTHPQRE